MEKIETFAQNCTLVAVKSVLNGTRTDDEILEAFRKHGYVDNQGLHSYKWHNAARSLGLVLKEVKIERKYEHKWIDVNEDYTCYVEPHSRLIRKNKYTLGRFVKDHPTGTYFVGTPGHALVVVDGAVHDPNCIHSGLAREVTCAVLVANSPLKNAVGGKIRMMAVPSRMSASRDRRMSAHEWIQKFGPTSGSDLVKYTAYTAADLRWDEKRGSLKYV